MKQIYVLLIGLFVLTSMTSCGGVKNDPVEISNAAVECIQKGKFTDLRKLWAEGKGTFTAIDAWQEAYDNPSEGDERFAEKTKELVESEYTLGEQSVDENSAKIKFKKKEKDGSESTLTIRLEKTDGQWYILSIL